MVIAMMTDPLATLSLVATYSAIAVYVLAFVAFTVDLSARSARALAAQDVTVHGDSLTSSEREAAPVFAAANGTVPGTAVLEYIDIPTLPDRRGTRFGRVAVALTVIAWMLHVTSTVLRGIANGYVPWSNMFEFALVGTGIMTGMFLLLNFKRDLQFLGTFITGIVAILLGLATVNFYVDVVPLAVPLQSAWLVIHVFVASLGTAFFAVGAGLSIMQVLQARRGTGKRERAHFLDTLPTADKLESRAYRVIIIGFMFWTFTLMAGSIWAEQAWGRYWGWDTKEVWTFIVWVVFAGYIHARATRGWRGTRTAWLAIIGFSTVLFNFTVVNLFFNGLHSYSGIPGVDGP